jgi:hypothetical protein
LTGFSTAELQKKLSALAMSENPTGQKSPAGAAAPPPVPPAQQKAGKVNESQKKQTKAQAPATPAAEEGIHTSKRSRNPNSAAAESEAEAEEAKPTVARGTVSNKVTKPSGRGDTLRQAVEAKKP